MLDLHCHILPGVDDGAATMEEALAMARRLADDGVTHVTATPHFNPAIRVPRTEVLRQVKRLNTELGRAGVPLAILPGSEIQVTDTALFRRERSAGLHCLLGDGQRFALLEFPWRGRNYPADAPELVRWLAGEGVTPILAHPERTPYLADDADELRELAEAGGWFQVTVDSLLGQHGPRPRAVAEEILRDFPEVVLATDAHNLWRCSGLSVGYAWVRERFGPERAADLRQRSDGVLAELLRERSK